MSIPSPRIQSLRQRVTRLRLKDVDLARLSGLDKATVCTALGGKRNPLNSTIEKMEGAVTAEEQRLREALALQPGAAA